MSDDLKYRVTVDSKQAETGFARVTAGVNSTKAAAAGSSGIWAAYTSAMKAATAAVRGFFSALGVIGAIMGGINMVISLWKTLSETIRGPAVRAAEEAKKAATDLQKAEEEAARAAKQRFEEATDAARAYIQTLKEAAALEAAKQSDRVRVRSANTAEANANIDRQSASGELSKTAADAQKRMNNLLARQADLEDAKRSAEKAADDARAARDAKARDLQEAVAEEQRTGAESKAADRAVADHAAKYGAGRTGIGLLAAQEETRTRNTLGVNAAAAAARHDEAMATVDSRQAHLDAAEDYLAEVTSKTAREIEVLEAELAANAAEMAAAEAQFEALAAKERSATLDALGKEAAAEANKELDRQAAAGKISTQQTTAQQEVNNLQAQLSALEKARDEGAEIGGVQWDSAWIEKALSDVQGRLADALEKAAAAGTKKESRTASSSMVSAGNNPWQKIGAFAGNGASSVAQRHLQIAQRHLSLAEQSNARLQELVTQISKLEATT